MFSIITFGVKIFIIKNTNNLMKLLPLFIFLALFQKYTYAQFTSGIITFDKKTYQKIYNSMEEYGQIRIDTTTFRRYNDTKIIVIKHDSTKEVLTRLDSFRYYFNDSIICSIYIREPDVNKVQAYVYVYNYQDSSVSYYKVEDNIAVLKSVNKLNQESTDKILILKDINYENEAKIINGIQGFKLEHSYLQNITTNYIYGYVTNEIIMPDKYLLDFSYPIEYTPLELIKESEYQKWILTIRNFTPKKLDNPFEALKKDYNFK